MYSSAFLVIESLQVVITLLYLFNRNTSGQRNQRIYVHEAVMEIMSVWCARCVNFIEWSQMNLITLNYKSFNCQSNGVTKIKVDRKTHQFFNVTEQIWLAFWFSAKQIHSKQRITAIIMISIFVRAFQIFFSSTRVKGVHGSAYLTLKSQKNCTN